MESKSIPGFFHHDARRVATQTHQQRKITNQETIARYQTQLRLNRLNQATLESKP